MDAGLIGGIIGGIGGLCGGVFGTYCSIKNTQSERERAYMIRWSLYFWVGVTAFLVVLFLVPFPYRAYLWIPYGPALMLAIRKCNKGQNQIRTDE